MDDVAAEAGKLPSTLIVIGHSMGGHVVQILGTTRRSSGCFAGVIAAGWSTSDDPENFVKASLDSLENEPSFELATPGF